MPKAFSPLFSSIRGTLKGGATFRANPQTPAITMQTKPVPTGAPTAKQAAVRAAYSRLAYLWKNLSALDKEPYQITAEERRITAWNAFLSFHMPIMCLSPLFYTAYAEGTGSTIQDFAINGITGNATGPAWTEQNTFPALSFDGIDDKLIFNRVGYYDLTNDYTFFFILKTGSTYPSTMYLLGNRSGSSNTNGIQFAITTAGALYLYWGNGTTAYNVNTAANLAKSTLHVIGAIKSGPTVTLYYNGITASTTRASGIVSPRSQALTVGATAAAGYPYKGDVYMSAIIPRAELVSTLETLDRIYRPFYY